LVTRTDSERPQSNLKTDRAAGYGNAAADSYKFGKYLLQFGHLRSHDEMPVRQHPVEPLVNFSPELAVLRSEVYKLHSSNTRLRNSRGSQIRPLQTRRKVY